MTSTGQLGDVALDHIPLLRTTEDLTVRGARVVMVQVMDDGHPLLTIHLEACQMATRHQQVTGFLNKYNVNCNILRGSCISLSSCGSLIVVKLEIGDVGFCGERKTRALREILEKAITNKKLNPHTCMTLGPCSVQLNM